MTAKREATYLQKWMKKGKDLGKEPPRASDAPYNVEQSDHHPRIRKTSSSST